MRIGAGIGFQFPTGWNSTGVPFTIKDLANVRFNSQRDGILQAGIELTILDLDKFQFPTGWNSTLRLFGGNKRQKAVSIPNGMEFYVFIHLSRRIAHTFQFPTGWNSTKTGKAKREKAKRFQLPTGWNSTLPPIKSLGTHTSFNSQRDGILLLTMGSRFAHPRFNSQRDGILRSLFAPSLKAKTCFNSQRDGILLDIAPLLLRCLGAFQFPTGWNSTMMMIKEKRGKCEFQFPTGWNST